MTKDPLPSAEVNNHGGGVVDKTKNRWDLWGKLFIGLWAASCSVLVTLLVAGHVAPFMAAPVLATTVLFTHKLNDTFDGWQALHIVADGCNCSSDVVSHLVARGLDRRLSAEGVVLVGHSPELEQKLKTIGFRYAELAPGAVTGTTGIEAAPTLVVISPTGEILYTGGYYAKRERTEALDGKIVGLVMAGQAVKPLPLFGCAFSKRLQAATDPLGLKYYKPSTGKESEGHP